MSPEKFPTPENNLETKEGFPVYRQEVLENDFDKSVELVEGLKARVAEESM